jgi:anti-sigma regulatory factor (Ser/Thr protein kinase)/GAF domain-containing protein
MSKKNTDSMLIETPCRVEAVRGAARLLRSFLAEQGIVESELNAWELVAMEAGTNAVQNTPRQFSSSKDNSVRFLMNAWPDTVELCITDHSNGFEWPENIELPSDDSEHGRGLFLINSLTDNVRYLRGRRENFLIMRKARQKSRPTSDVPRDSDLESTLKMMTEELGSTYESLSAIFRFSSDLGRVDDSKACAAKWLYELMKVTSMEWFSLLQLDEVNSALFLTASSSMATDEKQLISLEQAHLVEIDAALQCRDIWFNENTPASALESLSARFGPILCGVAHPIYVGSQLFGVLCIGIRSGKADFSISQVNVVHTFADFLGIQLSNVNAQQEAVEARIVNNDLQVAAGIQRSLLPRKLPRLSGLHIAARSQNARQVGGDFYDVILDDEVGILFAIADVMGKGVPAAMFAAILRSQLRARPDLLGSPAKLMAWLNQVLYKDLDRVDMFVTAQLVYLELDTRQLTVVSAGHCPVMLTESPFIDSRQLSGDGPPLGITRDAFYTEEQALLKPNARLLMLTDGLIEVRNPKGQQTHQ